MVSNIEQCITDYLNNRKNNPNLCRVERWLDPLEIDNVQEDKWLETINTSYAKSLKNILDDFNEWHVLKDETWAEWYAKGFGYTIILTNELIAGLSNLSGYQNRENAGIRLVRLSYSLKEISADIANKGKTTKKDIGENYRNALYSIADRLVDTYTADIETFEDENPIYEITAKLMTKDVALNILQYLKTTEYHLDKVDGLIQKINTSDLPIKKKNNWQDYMDRFNNSELDFSD